jgi:hypothetical protein
MTANCTKSQFLHDLRRHELHLRIRDISRTSSSPRSQYISLGAFLVNNRVSLRCANGFCYHRLEILHRVHCNHHDLLLCGVVLLSGGKKCFSIPRPRSAFCRAACHGIWLTRVQTKGRSLEEIAAIFGDTVEHEPLNDGKMDFASGAEELRHDEKGAISYIEVKR